MEKTRKEPKPSLPKIHPPTLAALRSVARDLDIEINGRARADLEEAVYAAMQRWLTEQPDNLDSLTAWVMETPQRTKVVEWFADRGDAPLKRHRKTMPLYTLHEEIMFAGELTSTERITLAYILSLTVRHGYCWAKNVGGNQKVFMRIETCAQSSSA